MPRKQKTKDFFINSGSSCYTEPFISLLCGVALDSDDEFTASIDAIVDLYTAGEECHELILRMADILDKSYPLIMQSVWS